MNVYSGYCDEVQALLTIYTIKSLYCIRPPWDRETINKMSGWNISVIMQGPAILHTRRFVVDDYFAFVCVHDRVRSPFFPSLSTYLMSVSEQHKYTGKRTFQCMSYGESVAWNRTF